MSRRATLRRALRDTILVAGFAAIVVGVYVGIVFGLGRVPTTGETSLLIWSAAAAGVVAALVLALRNRIGRFATRVAYGTGRPPEDVVRAFASRLSRALPLDELLLQMVESLRASLSIDAAEVWTASAGTLERSVSLPDRPRDRIQISDAERAVVARAGVSGPAWMKVWLPTFVVPEDEHARVAPIAHGGELFGLIFIRRSAGAQAFSVEEERILTELARHVALAMRNVHLDSELQASLDELREQAADLQASRTRLVTASDAARRTLERNLHDGAQQYLVALAVKVRLARDLLAKDPDGASSMLVELSADVQETLEELRRLAQGIYPPLLADRGLGEALRSAAGRASLPAGVEINGLGRYPAETEAAVYFCALEALQNAAKHAGHGARATVRVWEQEGALLFEVADDGAGFDDDDSAAGSGFTNMNDRLGAIGGTLRVDSAAGEGTTVAGRIPLN